MSPRGSMSAMRDYAAKKPVAITADGKFVLPSAAAGGGPQSFGVGIGSLHSLETPLKQKLVLERIKLDPRYDLGIFGVGRFTKDEVIANVEQRTSLGQDVMQAEVNYCNQFLAGNVLAPQGRVPARSRPKLPVTPSVKPPLKKLWAKTTALFCENTTDQVTNHAALYRINCIHPVFVAKGFKVVCLKGADDTRANFVVEAKKPFGVYFGGIGHGNPTVYTGDQGSPILEVGSYDPKEVKGDVIHLLSCLTAQQLGKDLVAKGAKAYAGYFQTFTFIWDDPGTKTNEEELFWKCDGTFDLSMANGCTVEQAHNATIKAFNDAIALVPNTSAATWLTWDRDYFRSPVSDTAYGAPTATISPKKLLTVPTPFTLDELVQAS